MLPFGNTLALKKMSGASLLSSLEWGVSALGTSAGTGRFPQVCKSVGWDDIGRDGHLGSLEWGVSAIGTTLGMGLFFQV